MRSRRGMHSTTLDVTRKQRQFLPFTNVRHNLASNFWCLNSILFLGFSWGYQLSYLLDLSSTSIPPPLKYQVSRRWRAHVVFKMSSSIRALIFCQTLKRHSLGALGRAWERLRSIFPATGAKLPHPTEPQLPRLAAFQFISVALIHIFELLPIHFHLFQRYIINLFDRQNPSAVWPPSISHLMECFQREVVTFLLLLSS